MRTFGRNRYGRWLLGLVFLLAACQPAPPPSQDVLDFLMPAPAEFEVSSVEHKSVLVADSRAVGVKDPEALEILHAAGIDSSAYFKYWLDDKAAYKVRLNVYRHPQAMQDDWRRRYDPGSLADATLTNWGDEGFLIGSKVGAFRDGLVLVEISSAGGAPALPAFLDVYAAFVREQVQK